jgi:hypothetical protein
MSANQSLDRLRPQLLASVQAVLDTPWILDIYTTVKTLFGKQSGAEVGYYPHKPGRPSHVPHTYFASNLRMVLDVVVCPGKQHSAAHDWPTETQHQQVEWLVDHGADLVVGHLPHAVQAPECVHGRPDEWLAWSILRKIGPRGDKSMRFLHDQASRTGLASKFDLVFVQAFG